MCFLNRQLMQTATGGVLTALFCFAGAPTVPAQDRPGSAGAPEFRPIRLLGEFPAIQDVPVLAATAVDEEVLDSELVLGVVVDGEARAYPINMLNGPKREIINDRLGGRSIAATW